MRKFFKKYWFTMLITLFVSTYLMVFLFVLFSPKEDDLERGFIPCTKQMSEKILKNEEQSTLKLVKIIVENTYCDTKVVAKGFVNWLKGEQKTPWANYFFEPVLEKNKLEEDEELMKFYQENPYLSEDMENLDKERKILEQTLMQQETLDAQKIMKPFEYEEDVEEKLEEEEENEQKQPNDD